jgi:4-amino-4-deoxychorismate lyase
LGVCGAVRVALLDRGYRHDISVTAPWLLVGAKTLSYALNRSALREAARRGADDVVFISSDGYVLEGTTSSVVLRRGGVLLTPGGTADARLGILDGTTQGDLFRWAARRGIATDAMLVTAAELRTSDAAWLVSSGRQAVPVRSIDGVPHPVDTKLTAEMNSYLSTGTG